MSASTAAPHSSPAPYGTNVWDVPLPEGTKLYHGWLPDFDGGRSKRLEVRRAHIEYAQVAFQRGWIVAGGAIFADDTSRTDMVGSWILYRALDLDDAKQRLSQDIYATGGAWDMSKAVISPIAQAPLGDIGGEGFAGYLQGAK